MSSIYLNQCDQDCAYCKLCKNDDSEFCKEACHQCKRCGYRHWVGRRHWQSSPYYYPGHFFPGYYPPAAYYYFNPPACEDKCNPQVCHRYHEKRSNYRNCLICQKQNPPKCWNSIKHKCEDCPLNEAMEQCHSRTRFGSPNPLGPRHADVPPVNPAYNDCRLEDWELEM